MRTLLVAALGSFQRCVNAGWAEYILAYEEANGDDVFFPEHLAHDIDPEHYANEQLERFIPGYPEGHNLVTGSCRPNCIDHPLSVLPVDILRKRICREGYPTPDIDLTNKRQSNDRLCPVKNVPTLKFGLRNYGCNCFPDNWDYLYTTGGNAFRGVPSWHVGINGVPIDDVDLGCQRLAKRFQCIEQDVRDGIFPEIVTAWSWQENNRAVCLEGGNNYPNCTYDRQVDPYVKNQYHCGRNIHPPYFSDPYGNVYCGNITNPDYVNGIPEGEECLAAACFSMIQFAAETYDKFKVEADNQFRVDGVSYLGHKTVPEFDPDSYFRTNIQNYFAFAGLVANQSMDYDDIEQTNWYITRGKMELRSEEYMANIIFTPTYLIQNAIDVREIVETKNFTISHWHKPWSTTETECVHPNRDVGGGGTGEIVCCGQYPHRYPMNPETQECCDGLAVVIGKC